MLVCIYSDQGILRFLLVHYNCQHSFYQGVSSDGSACLPSSVTRCWHGTNVSDIIAGMQEGLILEIIRRTFGDSAHLSMFLVVYIYIVAMQRIVTSEDGVEAVWRLEVRIRETYL